MKLFLASLAINDAQAAELIKLVGKPASQLKLALFENAADPDEPNVPAWVTYNRAAIMSHGFEVERLDLRRYRDRLDDLRAKLKTMDVIWFGGGNTFYLRWLLRDTGTEAVIRELVEAGTIYGGGSAGAIMAGPALKHFEAADDPADAPEVIWEGLGFTQTVVVPHIDHVRFSKITTGINDALIADGFPTAPLTDTQTLIVDDGTKRIL